MTALPQQRLADHGNWPSYRNNMPRHLIALSRHLRSRLMSELISVRGHTGLKLHFEPFMTLIGQQGVRITDLAEQLAISKQAVNQSVNQIEAAGYLQRCRDPDDGRAKKVLLTARGEQLLEDGAALLGEVEQELQQLIGKKQLARLTRNLYLLYQQLGFQQPDFSLPGSAIGWLLPRLSDFTMQRLMELTRERGHPGLKMSFAQVLNFVGPERSGDPGGRIQAIARINEVSKQAIGAIANDLQEQGYLGRNADPVDRRQVRLVLTSRGEQLIEDSVASIVDLEQSIADLLGPTALAELKADSLDLYEALQLEQDVFGQPTATGRPDLVALAARLQLQLGRAHARALADVLMTITEVEQ